MLNQRKSLLCILVMMSAIGNGASSAETFVATIIDQDLTAVIDRHLQDRWSQLELSPAACCNDEVFIRRVYLDLAGRIPTIAEVDTFLCDTRDDRRERLVDDLLDREDHVQHFADLLDTILMGRASEQTYQRRKNHHWRSYLESVIRDNRPWNQIAAEILLARPENAQDRGAVWFLYERNNNHQQIAEAVAPAFFGMRIDCAQCHDHMMADEILQDHYWGLVAFFARSKNIDTPAGPRVGESAIGGFSEFANIEGESSPNLLTFLASKTIEEDRPAKGVKQEDAAHLYLAETNEGEPKVPKFSRRQAFVDRVLKNHPLVARTMANRLWAILMSRGLVQPVDEMDSMHPPSHPELLDQLTTDFANSGYNIRRLVRAIVLSEAYQLESIRPSGVDDPATFAWYLERPLTAEQLARSIHLSVRGVVEHENELLEPFRQQFKAVLPDENVVTVSDTLFLSNHSEFDRYLRASCEPDHLIPRLLNVEDHSKQTELMFRAVFGRAATAEEQKETLAYLARRTHASEEALQQVLWALLTSAEFRFNH